jgi:hypothetical protein
MTHMGYSQAFQGPEGILELRSLLENTQLQESQNLEE